MTTFSYTAIDSKKNIITSTIDEPDRQTALTSLTKQGLQPITLKEVDANNSFLKGGFDLNSLFGGGGKVKSASMVMMTRQLSAMISAGVPILRALNSLESHAEDKALKVILQAVIKDVQSGRTLADALGAHPKTFNDIYVNMVRAGESAGILDDILKRLATQQEKSAGIGKKVKSAMMYPTVILCVTILAFFGLMIFIVPKIGGILTNLGGPNAKLPSITLAMLAISHAITGFWYIIFPVLIGGVVLLVRYLKTPKGRDQFQRLSLKIPAFGSMFQKVAVARFSRTFSALMGAGVPVLECLGITGKAMGNIVYEEILRDAAKQVKNGKQLSEVLAATPLFPPIVSQMLAVGEETGQTDSVLVKVADFYDEEVDTAVNGISSIIEPVVIVIMGGMVGLIAASVMLPIAELSTSIQS